MCESLKKFVRTVYTMIFINVVLMAHILVENGFVNYGRVLKMTEKRFTITQKEDYFYVRDEIKKKPMGMFEFKQDEFPVYFCFHKIIDLLNEQHEEIKELRRHLDVMQSGALTDDKRIKELYDENEQLKKENKKLHTKIFEMRTNIALERTEISKETYTGKKNAKEFLDGLKKW